MYLSRREIPRELCLSLVLDAPELSQSGEIERRQGRSFHLSGKKEQRLLNLFHGWLSKLQAGSNLLKIPLYIRHRSILGRLSDAGNRVEK